MKHNVEENISQIQSAEGREQLNKNKETNKGVIGVVVAISIIIILIGVGAYSYISRDGGDEANPTPTDEPTVTQETPIPVSDPYEGWQTYESEEFGFSFRYPEGWDIEIDENVITISDPVSIIGPYGEEHVPYIRISYDRNITQPRIERDDLLRRLDVGESFIQEAADYPNDYDKIFYVVETTNEFGLTKYYFEPKETIYTDYYKSIFATGIANDVYIFVQFLDDYFNSEIGLSIIDSFKTITTK